MRFLTFELTSRQNRTDQTMIYFLPTKNKTSPKEHMLLHSASDHRAMHAEVRQRGIRPHSWSAVSRCPLPRKRQLRRMYASAPTRFDIHVSHALCIALQEHRPEKCSSGLSISFNLFTRIQSVFHQLSTTAACLADVLCCAALSIDKGFSAGIARLPVDTLFTFPSVYTLGPASTATCFNADSLLSSKTFPCTPGEHPSSPVSVVLCEVSPKQSDTDASKICACSQLVPATFVLLSGCGSFEVGHAAYFCGYFVGPWCSIASHIRRVPRVQTLPLLSTMYLYVYTGCSCSTQAAIPIRD